MAKKKAKRKTSKKPRSKASSAKKKTRAKAAKKKTSKKKKKSVKKEPLSVLVRRRNAIDNEISRRYSPQAPKRTKAQKAATAKLGSKSKDFFTRNAQAREDRQALE